MDMALDESFAVYMGAPNSPDGTLSNISLSRLNTLVSVVREKKVNKIILTGGFGQHFNQSSSPHWFWAKSYLVNLGVPEHWIVACLETQSTESDVKEVSRFLDGAECSELIVVTSDFHVMRTRLLFLADAPNLKVSFVPSATIADDKTFLSLATHEVRRIAFYLQSRFGITP